MLPFLITTAKITAANNCLGGRRLDPQEQFAANLLCASYDPAIAPSAPSKTVVGRLQVSVVAPPTAVCRLISNHSGKTHIISRCLYRGFLLPASVHLSVCVEPVWPSVSVIEGHWSQQQQLQHGCLSPCTEFTMGPFYPTAWFSFCVVLPLASFPAS